MPGPSPEGQPAPADGRLPAAALSAWRADLPAPAGPAAAPPAFGAYLHVPFCARRCGYCDFTTYTPSQWSGLQTSPAAYLRAVVAEMDLAAVVLGLPARPLDTVFLGGGTPTFLPGPELVGLLRALADRFPLARRAEVTVEANPDSVSPGLLGHLADAGVTRVSFGMQSAVPRVLAALERSHDPDAVGRAVGWARAAGLGVSLDLIYGAPGESLDDWLASLAAAVALGPDHLSAYALVVEDGTALAARVRRGEVPPPDEDDQADKYLAAERALGEAGYCWYELSNWARREVDRCRHNLGYWRDGDWWGFGPGAHSHVRGVRWWNVKHPGEFARRLDAGVSPAQAREVLTPQQRHVERVMLGVRLAEGLPLDQLDETGQAAAGELVEQGLAQLADARPAPRLVLTTRGRLLADAAARRLLGW